MTNMYDMVTIECIVSKKNEGQNLNPNSTLKFMVNRLINLISVDQLAPNLIDWH